jgi:hypothetical protein
MGIPTHVMVYTDGWAATMSDAAGPLQFLGPLRAFGTDGNWYVTFYRLPDGKSYEDVRGETTTEYIQAAGDAEAMVLDIRKAGGEQWGAQWGPLRHRAPARRHPAGRRGDPAAEG